MKLRPFKAASLEELDTQVLEELQLEEDLETEAILRRFTQYRELDSGDDE